MAVRDPISNRSTRSTRSYSAPVKVRHRRFRRLRRLLVAVVILGSMLLGAWVYVQHVYAPVLESEARTIPARVNSGLAQHSSSYTPLSLVSLDLQHAIVAIEDHRFYSHPGVDPLGSLRALWVNLQNRHVDQGGSTLEEQLAKRAIVGDDRSIHDKLRTVGLAWAIDQVFPKAKVLELYLNAAYFGRGAYGPAEAARVYFGANVGRLTLSQAAFLAAMPQAPSLYGSHPNSPTVRARWTQVLYDMAKDGYITSDELSAAQHSSPSFAFGNG
jgi:membrane peptidoglycan carboxypeptidase